MESDVEQEENSEDEDECKEGIPRSRPDPYSTLDFAAPDVPCQLAFKIYGHGLRRSGSFYESPASVMRLQPRWISSWSVL